MYYEFFNLAPLGKRFLPVSIIGSGFSYTLSDPGNLFNIIAALLNSSIY
jgi:hypothetical protein